MADDKAIQSIRSIRGVETAFPDIRFPARIELNGQKEFTLVQALPVKFARSKLINIQAGRTFSSEDEPSVIIHSSLLPRLGIKDTMIMSIMERYKEIGIMKAVGAGNKDIKKVFFFETSVIAKVDPAVALRHELGDLYSSVLLPEPEGGND